MNVLFPVSKGVLGRVYVVIRLIFFAVSVCNKKVVMSCIFFAKKLHDVTIFLHAFTAKKQKKITRPYSKKKLTILLKMHTCS